MKCYTLWKCGDNLSIELSWLSTVFYLLQIAGYNFPSISNYLEINEGITVKNLKTELEKLYRQHFFKTISLSSKLAPIYGKIKRKNIGKNHMYPKWSTINIDQLLLG